MNKEYLIRSRDCIVDRLKAEAATALTGTGRSYMLSEARLVEDLYNLAIKGLKCDALESNLEFVRGCLDVKQTGPLNEKHWERQAEAVIEQIGESAE